VHRNEHSNLDQHLADCRSANARLQTCYQMFRNGFYENAVGLAQQTPDLLPECARLIVEAGAFSESLSDEMRKLVEQNQIVEANVVALQEAYDKAETFARFNDQLRKLVLVRALAPSRLQVMRQMLAIDPSHPFLEQDIRDLELAWFRDVPEYANRFSREGATDAIQELAADITTSNYLENIPPSLLSLLEKALQTSRSKQLPTVQNAIRQQLEAQDLAAITASFEALDSLLSETGQSAENLDPEMAEARKWMKERQREIDLEQEKASAKARLSRSIQNSKCPRADVEIAFAKASALGVVDESLEHQYYARIESTQRKRQTNYFVVGVTAFLIAVLVPTVIFTMVRHWAHASAVEGSIAKVKSGPLQSEDYDQALADIDELPEDVRHTQDIVEFRESVVHERKRHQAYKKVLSDIENPEESLLSESQIDKLIAQAEEERWLDETRRSRLKEAKEARLKRNEVYLQSEKLKLAEWLQHLNSRINQLKILMHPGGDLQYVKEQLQELEQFVADKIKQKDDIRAEQGTEGVELLVSGENAVTALQSDLDVLLQYEKQVRAMNSGLSEDDLVALLTMHERLKRTEEPVADELQEAYQNIRVLTQHLAEMKEPPETVSRAILVIPQFRETYNACQRELSSVASRQSFASFVSYLRDPKNYIADLWMYREPEGIPNHHYFTKKPEAGKVGPAPLGNGIESSPHVVPPESYSVVAPQSKFAEFAIPKLEKAGPGQWHATFEEIYERLRTGKEEREIDPILRAILIAKLIDTGREGSTSFANFFARDPAYMELRQKTQEWVNKNTKWYDNNSWRGSIEFKSARQFAEKKIPEMPQVPWQLCQAEDKRRLNLVADVIQISGVCTFLSGKFCPFLFDESSDLEGVRHYVLAPDDSTLAIDLSESSVTSRYELEYLPVISIKLPVHSESN